MFTLDQIKEAHSKVKSGADFPSYVQELKALGLIAYDAYVTDGHTEYRGADGLSLNGDAKYAEKNVALTGDAENLKRILKIHQQGGTDYLTFCEEAAQSGVEKWTTHVADMTCTYYDKAGNKMLVEEIPGA